MPAYPFITQRLWEVHKSTSELDAYVSLLQRQRGACDEVWFATDYGFPPLSAHWAAAAKMAAAAERIRALGIVASLQISNTLGHGEYLKYLDFEGIRWQRMVGADGVEAPYSNCPRNPDFHTYLDATTRAYCAWRPASVWIDDDLRMNHHGRVDYGCFCPLCLEAFNAVAGSIWTREALVAALNANDGRCVREAWLVFGRKSLARVAEVIAAAVQAVAPECRLGLQHGDPSWGGYNGPDLVPVFETLARVSARPVGSRPGGGFYTDHAPREMLHKALFGGLQISRLPACVDDVRMEIENLPGAVSGKSARGTAIEATLALAYGCTGLTFTPLMFTHEEIAWQEHVLAELAAWRPFWLQYAAAGEGTRPAGLAVALGRSFVQRLLQPGERPFAWASCNMGGVAQLATLGLPLCCDWETSPTLLLHPHAADGLTDVEVCALAGRGVVTDGETLQRLHRRGLAEALPLAAVAADEKDATEQLTGDPLNGPFAGRAIGLTALSRAFPAYALASQTDTRILARYARPDGTPGATATAAVETAAGGRWVVFGNGCWSPVLTTARRAQMLAAADWVSGCTMPVLLETPGQVAAIPRTDAAGRLCNVVLLNCSLDATPPLRLRLRRPRGVQAIWTAPFVGAKAVALDADGTGAEASAVLPGLEPWAVGALLLSEL